MNAQVTEMGKITSGKCFSPAELEQNLLENQNRSCAPQYRQWLPGKQRIGHTGHRSPKQRLNGTLE